VLLTMASTPMLGCSHFSFIESMVLNFKKGFKN
jgi:hypothetical protein